ncbi:TPA: hypothetical protein DEP21_01805, partial [Patescibacteria group bacterium]|nr:hypothetical protein [Candidatus Gracilibacteria bacterium]
IIETPLMQTVTYTVAQINVTTGGTDSTYKVDSTKLVEFGQFTLTASGNTANNKDLTVKSMTLTQKGDASLDYLSDLALYRNEEKVSTDAIINGRDVTFLLDNTIKYTSTSATYVVKGKIVTAERVGDKFQFQMKYPENLEVIEDTTSFRASIFPATAMDLASYTVNGADLKFNQGPMTYNKTIIPGAKGVVFYSGTISTLGTVNLENLTLTAIAGTGNIDEIVKTFYLKVGGNVLSASAVNTNTGTILFEGTVAVNGTQNFVIYADIKDTAPATSIKFLENISLGEFKGVNEYASNGENISSSIGTFQPVNFTISAANLTLSNSISSTKTVVKNDRNIDLANIEFSTSTDVQASVKSFKATLTGTNRGNFKGGTVTLYDADGVALVSNTIDSGSSTMSFLLPTAARIVKNSAVSFMVKLDQVSTYVTGGDELKLIFNTVYATNITTSNELINTATATSATLKVVSAGQVNIVSQTLTNKLIKLNGSTATVGTIKFKPYNGDAVLKTLTLAGMDVSKFSKVVLKDSGSLVATFVKSGTNELYVDNIQQTIAADAIKLYEVEATMISASTSGDLAPSTGKLILQSATFENTNGQDVQVVPSSADISATNTLVKVSPLVTDIATIKGSNYASYKITLQSPDGEVKVTDLVLAVGGNVTGTTISLTSSENGGTVYSSVPYTTTPALSGSITVDPTAPVVLYVNVEGVTWSTTSNSDPYVFIGLSDLGYSDIFSDASEANHANMLKNYKSSLTSITDLGRNIK